MLSPQKMKAAINDNNTEKSSFIVYHFYFPWKISNPQLFYFQSALIFLCKMKLKPSFSAISPFYCLVLKTFSALNEMCFYLLNKTLEVWFSTSWFGICFHKNLGNSFNLENENLIKAKNHSPLGTTLISKQGCLNITLIYTMD